MIGTPAADAARWRAWRSASVMGLSPIDLRGMVPLRSVTSRNPKRSARFGFIPRMGYTGSVDRRFDRSASCPHCLLHRRHDVPRCGVLGLEDRIGGGGD